MGSAQRGLGLGRRRGPGEDEPEIRGALGQRHDALAQMQGIGNISALPTAGTPLVAPVPVTYLPYSDTGRPRSRCHSVPTDRPRGQQSLSEGSFAVRMDLDVGNRSKCRITSRDFRHLREECALAG